MSTTWAQTHGGITIRSKRITITTFNSICVYYQPSLLTQCWQLIGPKTCSCQWLQKQEVSICLVVTSSVGPSDILRAIPKFGLLNKSVRGCKRVEGIKRDTLQQQPRAKCLSPVCRGENEERWRRGNWLCLRVAFNLWYATWPRWNTISFIVIHICNHIHPHKLIYVYDRHSCLKLSVLVPSIKPKPFGMYLFTTTSFGIFPLTCN